VALYPDYILHMFRYIPFVLPLLQYGCVCCMSECHFMYL